MDLSASHFPEVGIFLKLDHSTFGNWEVWKIWKPPTFGKDNKRKLTALVIESIIESKTHKRSVCLPESKQEATKLKF